MSRYDRCGLFAPLLLLLLSAAADARAAERPNVLFLAVDDLRPEMTCFGAGEDGHTEP